MEIKKRLNKNDLSTYEDIVRYTKVHLYPPSYREIAEMGGILSSSTVFSRVNKLVNAGLIEKKNSEPRAIKIVGYEFIKREIINDEDDFT